MINNKRTYITGMPKISIQLIAVDLGRNIREEKYSAGRKINDSVDH